MGSNISIDLTTHAVTSYDKTKVSLMGRAQLQTVGGAPAVGGPLSKFIDVFTDTGLAPVGPMWVSPNNRLFVLVSAVSTAAQVALYEFNPTTGAYVYVGRMAFALPNSAATTHTFRGIRVANDASNSASDWRLYAVTAGSVLPNGGPFCVNKIGRANFTQVLGATIPMATSTDQQAVYFLQNPNAMGVLHTDTACAGQVFERSTGRLYVHHGIAATHQYVCHDTTVASLVYNTTGVTVSAATPGFVSYPGHPYLPADPIVFTSGTLPTGLTLGTTYWVRNPTSLGFECAPLVTILTSVATTGNTWIFTVTSANATAGATYTNNGLTFTVVNTISGGTSLTCTSAVAGAPTANGTLTKASGTGDATITFSAVVSATVQVGRAYGQTGSGWLFRTGNLPALAGTVLLTDTENNAVPTSSPLNGAALNGRSCISIITSSNLYLGLISELAATATQTVAISVASPGVVTYNSHPFAVNDSVIFSAGTLPTGLTVGTTYYVRNPALNSLELSLTSGGASINTTGAAGTGLISRAILTWPSLTTANLLGATNQVTAVAATMGDWDSLTDGFVYVTNTTRFMGKQLVNNSIRFIFGVINNDYYEGLIDPRIQFGLAAVAGVTRSQGWLFASGTTIGQRGVIMMDLSVDDYYQTSHIITPVINLKGVNLTTYSHYWKLYEYVGDTLIYYRSSGFDTADGGWIGPVSRSEPINAHIESQVQFKIGFTVQSENYATSSLLTALNVAFDTDYAISPNWEYTHDNSSTGVPTRVGFRLKSAYTGVVPKMHFRAYDTENSLLTHFNTIDNPTYFEYSTDSGSSWLPLGTVANVAGTLLRFTFVSPPGVPIRASLQEV